MPGRAERTIEQDLTYKFEPRQETILFGFKVVMLHYIHENISKLLRKKVIDVQ